MLPVSFTSRNLAGHIEEEEREMEVKEGRRCRLRSSDSRRRGKVFISRMFTAHPFLLLSHICLVPWACRAQRSPLNKVHALLVVVVLLLLRLCVFLHAQPEEQERCKNRPRGRAWSQGIQGVPLKSIQIDMRGLISVTELGGRSGSKVIHCFISTG